MNFSEVDAVEECNSYFSNELLFNTIVILLFLLFGLFGNAQVLYLYKYKVPQTEERFFIPPLAVADLLSCVCLALLGITINFNYIFFPYEILCQLLHYFSWVTTSWSAFILLMISVSRYLKICRPSGNQMTLFRKKCAVGGCLLFAIINTLPVAYFTGFRFQKVDCLHKNITVQMCELREFDGATNTLKMIYILVEMVVIFSNVGLTGGLYIPIGLQIFRRFKVKKFIQTASTGATESTDEARKSTTTSKVIEETSFKEPEPNANISPNIKNNPTNNSENEVEMKEKQFEDEARKFVNTEVVSEELFKAREKNPCNSPYSGNMKNNKSNSNNILQRKQKSTKMKRHRDVRNNFTYMFITIIVCYILSYLPTFVTILLATDDPFHYWYSMDTIVLNVEMLLRRSSIINHIVNPIIYGYFDVAFRIAFLKSFKCRNIQN